MVSSRRIVAFASLDLTGFKRLRRLTQFLTTPDLDLLQTGDPNAILESTDTAGVCHNQVSIARKRLILKTERCPSG